MRLSRSQSQAILATLAMLALSRAKTTSTLLSAPRISGAAFSTATPLPGGGLTSEFCMDREPNLVDASDELRAATNAMLKNLIQELWDDPVRRDSYLSSDLSLYAFLGSGMWGVSSNKLSIAIKDDIEHSPTCQEIIEYQNKHSKNRTAEQIESDAAMISLMMAQLEGLHFMMKDSHDTITSAMGSLARFADEAVLDFTDQPDLVADARCSIAKIREGLFLATFDFAAELTDDIINELKILCKALAKPVDIVCDVIDIPSKLLKWGRKTIELSRQREQGHKEIHALEYVIEQIEARAKYRREHPHGRPQLHQLAYADLCHTNGKDHNFENAAELKGFESDQLANYQGAIEEIWSNTTRPMTLDQALDSASFMEKANELVGHVMREAQIYSNRQKDIDRKTRGHLITSLYKGGHCAMTCQVGGTFQANCTADDAFRYCPRENEICSFQCFSTFQSNNHEIVPYGYDKMERWGLDLKVAMFASRLVYEVRGNSNETYESRDTISHSLMTAVDPLDNYIQMVVCRSRSYVLNPFEKNLGQNSFNYPCHCGDWMGNETAIVQNAMLMGRNSTDYINGWVADTYKNTCAVLFQEKPPLSQYFASCGLGINHVGDLSRDPFCGVMWGIIRQERITEHGANFDFCKGVWTEAAMILESIPFYRKRCEKFLKNPDIPGYNWDPTTDYRERYHR